MGKTRKIDKISLFEELAGIDKDGVSRWVHISEFVGKYADLAFGNGGDWCRSDGAFGKKYYFKKEYGLTSRGVRGIVAIRTLGYNQQELFNQSIREDIKRTLRPKNCVMLGVRGEGNLQIEIDHKDGRKRDMRVSNPSTQRIDDFQPLSKVANDLKRNICMECSKTNIRWDATQIEGNIYPFYAGDEHYTPELGCIGCYMYDPVAYRKESFKRYFEDTIKSDSSNVSFSKDTFERMYNTISKSLLENLLKTMYGDSKDEK